MPGNVTRAAHCGRLRIRRVVDIETDVSAEQAYRDASFESVSTRSVLPMREHPRLGRAAIGREQTGNDRSRGLGGEEKRFFPVRRTGANQADTIGMARAERACGDAGSGVDDLIVAYLDVEI